MKYEEKYEKVKTGNIFADPSFALTGCKGRACENDQ